MFTDDPFWIRRLDRVAEFIRATGQGREYKLQSNQVVIRAIPKKRPLTDEQRRLLTERLKRGREGEMYTR